MPLNADRDRAKLLRRRKAYITAVVIAVLVFLALFNTGAWLFAKRMERHLEDELGKRLVSAASFTAGMLEEASYNLLSYEDRTLAQIELTRVQNANELQGAYIVDDSYTTLVSSQPFFTIGEPISYLRDDSLYFARAWQGDVVAAPLHVLEGNRFKTAYAPLHNDLAETSAVLVLEANADFFEVLRGYHQARFVGAIASVGLLLLLSAFLYWAVTLFLRTETSLRQAERLATMGQMAATVAHEIRNPLGVIKSTADVLRQKYDRSDHPNELFDFIPQETQRLNRLVNDFLLLSREPKLERTESNLRDSVNKAVETLRHEFEEKPVEVEIAIDQGIPDFPFDPDAIHQVLLNVLLNAIQATDPGGKITVSAEILNRKNTRYIRVAVADTGCGIEGDVDRIFDPFYTTKASGSGLGLAVTKKHIEGHGGWLEVKTEKNLGTTISFHLPLV